MTNRKSKSIRKIRPASTSAIPPLAPVGRADSPVRVAPRAVGNRACSPRARNGTSKHSPSRAKPSTPSLPPPINPPIHQSNHPSAARSRNGKVARLPCAVRDMINRMLRNNIPHSQIVDALDELQFKLTQRNISNWKTRGGYRDWCIAQDRALETRLLQDNLLEQLRKNDASQLAEVGLQLVATELSQFFLKPETRQQLHTEPEKLARTIGILCRLARQIHILQKYRDQSAKDLGDEHNPELLKHQTDETLDTIRDTYSAEKLPESINDPGISHRNFLPKNGYPADPPPDPPRDDTELRMRMFQELCDAIAAKHAAQEAEWRALHRSANDAPEAFETASSHAPDEPNLSDDTPPPVDPPATT